MRRVVRSAMAESSGASTHFNATPTAEQKMVIKMGPAVQCSGESMCARARHATEDSMRMLAVAL